MVNVVLIGFTLLGLFVLVRFGALPERTSAAAIAVYVVASPFVGRLMWDRWPIGYAGCELMLFLVIWLIAEWRPRWWLTAAGGFQLVAVISFAIPWILPTSYVWTAVTLRWVAWMLINLTLFAGAWEARADRRFLRDQAA